MFTGHRDCITDPGALIDIAARYPGSIWVHGGAAGFDAQVNQTAARLGIQTEIHKPDYAQFAAKQAPIIRNKQMLALADIVIACYDGRQTGGTWFVINAAKRAGKPVIILPAHHHRSIQPE